MQLITSMMPNIWSSLADEVPAWVSDKRNRTSVDRTMRWLDECISLRPVKSYKFLLLKSRIAKAYWFLKAQWFLIILQFLSMYV